MENCAGQLQLLPQGQGIAQIAVMGHRQLALQMVDLDGLAVAQIVAAGGAVADMSDSNLAVGKLPHFFLGKDFADKAESFVGSEHPILIDHDPAALLPTVLVGIKAVIDKAGHIPGGSAVYT